MNQFERLAQALGGRVAVGSLLIDRAAWVHQRLATAERLHLPLSEETVTETVLLDGCTALPRHVSATAYSRQDESRRTGADWEWWFGDGVGSMWFGVRVQAKKLKADRAGGWTFDLAYTPKSERAKSRPIRQVDRLLSSAAAAGLPAVYVLYNGPGLGSLSFPWPCCHFPPSGDLLGVGVVAATTAQSLADAKTLDAATVLSHARPWSCLALCPLWQGLHAIPGTVPPGPLPELALWSADLVAGLYAADPTSDRRPSERLPVGLFNWDEVPEHVRLAVMQAAGPEVPPDDLPDAIGGIVMFNSAGMG